jgi:hypothetical protein
MNTRGTGKIVDGVTLTLAALLAVFVVVEILFAPHYHPVFPWHAVPGYMGMIGLGACLLLVVLAKFVGKRFLQRPGIPETPEETHDGR